MQCPKCKYEPTMAEQQQSPSDCIRCGVNYEGHARHIAAANAKAEGQQVEARSQGLKVAPAVADATRQFPGAQPVVIVDIKMSFWSMVVFMVKWAFAAIPALLIICVLGAALFVFVAGFVSGIGGRAPSVTSLSGTKSNSASTFPERIVTPPSTSATFWLIGLREDDGIVHMTVRTDSADGSQLYSEFAVSCVSGRGMIVAAGKTPISMMPDPKVAGFSAIQPDTPRQAIAARGCRNRPETHEVLK